MAIPKLKAKVIVKGNLFVKGLPEKITKDVALKELTKGLNIVRRSIRRHIPVWTGALEKSVVVKITNRRKDFVAGNIEVVGQGVKYFRFIDTGWASTGSKKRPKGNSPEFLEWVRSHFNTANESEVKRIAYLISAKIFFGDSKYSNDGARMVEKGLNDSRARLEKLGITIVDETVSQLNSNSKGK